MHKCDDCQKILSDEELAADFPSIEGLLDRLEPGGMVPSGECPCGALAYPYKAPLSDECCPYCQSMNISGSSYDSDINIVSQVLDCADCKHEWRWSYSLSGLDLLDSNVEGD